MFAIATGYNMIGPGLTMTANASFAWDVFFRNVRDGYSTTICFKSDSENRRVGYDHRTKGFTFRNY